MRRKMIQVSYVSRASEAMTSEQLLELLMQCRRNNAKHDVTGMLLYGNGTFLQAIEGEEDVIDKLVETIDADPRHKDIRVLKRKSIPSRQYSDWSMGFDNVTDGDIGTVEGATDFGPADFNFDYLVGHEPVVDMLMRRYREPHWDQVIGEMEAKDRVIAHLKERVAQVSDRAQVARLALESLTEASRSGTPDESLIELCESTLESLRPR
jgi:hypothetical protein